MTIDLSSFRKTFVRDTEEDLLAIAAMKSTQHIPEGTHEVVITGIHEKDGEKFKVTEKAGGTLGFSLILQNAKKQEQMLYVSIPLHLTFLQACQDPDRGTKFMFSKTVSFMNALGVSPITLREAIMMSDGKAANALIGGQLVLVNSWSSKALHLEYDATAKAFFFVTGQGARIESGELSQPQSIDHKLGKDKYKEAIAIAYQYGFNFVSQMDSSIEPHPTATNEKISATLDKYIRPVKEEKPEPIVNKTVPFSFPSVKKTVASLDVEPDVEL